MPDINAEVALAFALPLLCLVAGFSGDAAFLKFAQHIHWCTRVCSVGLRSLLHQLHCLVLRRDENQAAITLITMHAIHVCSVSWLKSCMYEYYVRS
jgi:hypothetical protein